MNTHDINVTQKLIETLVKNGFNIVQFFPYNDNNALTYLAYEFNPPFKSATEEISFCSLKGINITEYVRNNASNPDAVGALARLQQIIVDPNVNIIRVEYDKNIHWVKYASAI